MADSLGEHVGPGVPQNTNILAVLGVGNKEDVITNLLAHCIEHSAAFRTVFLRDLCAVPHEGVGVTVLCRPRIAGDIPDLVLGVTGLSGDHLVVVENKILADEGFDQTRRYGSEECVRGLAERVGIRMPCNGQVSLIYLTLFPDQAADIDSRFETKHYSDLLGHADTLLSDQVGSVTHALVSALIEELRLFYGYGVVCDGDPVSEKLSPVPGIVSELDGPYLYFKELLEGVSLPQGLEPDGTFRMSRQGRHLFGAQYYREEWNPATFWVDGGRSADAFSEMCFSLHFEPQYDTLNNQLNLYLHYELNPYTGEKWAREHLDLSAYLRRREAFCDEFQRLTPDSLGVKFSAFWNMFAKVGLRDIATAGQFRTVLASLFAELAPVVDQALENIR